jgi:hypothetical protein
MRFEDLGGRFKLSTQSYLSPLAAPGVAESLVEVSLSIVREVRGPMRLWDFARRLEQRLGMPRTPTGVLCDAVKNAIEQINDPRLAVLATSMPGVGYVYDARDPDAKPVRASR